MSLHRTSSAPNVSAPNLALVNHRLSMLAEDEENGETMAQMRARLRGERAQEVTEAPLSEVSTIAATPERRSRISPKAKVTFPDLSSDDEDDAVGGDIEDRSGLSTPTTHVHSGTTTPGMGTASTRTDVGSIFPVNSHVVIFRKESIRKWKTYPHKGYETTTKHMYEEIDSHWTTAVIVVCFFVTGIVDSCAYQTYGCFTSLQTGNTIFLALRLSNQPANRHPFAYTKSIMSIACYCLGGLFFNILHRVPTELSNPKVKLHRWTMFGSFIVQSALLIASAGLSQSGYTSTMPAKADDFSSGSPRHPTAFDNYLDLLPIGFLAFEAAGQVCLSRVLMVNDLPTIVVSTLYHDFVSDALSWPKSWKARDSKRGWFWSQKKQARRLVCIAALFFGAVVAGFVYASKGGMPAALWIAAGSKCIISVCFCCWKRKTVTQTTVTKEIAPPEAVAPPEVSGNWITRTFSRQVPQDMNPVYANSGGWITRTFSRQQHYNGESGATTPGNWLSRQVTGTLSRITTV